MRFSGFEAADFELFSIPEFAGRMAAIRERVRPKLVALAEELTPSVEEILGVPTFPHVAQHMRRRVNPPAETWLAFARDKKGYKRWTHDRIAISGSGIRVTVFVEDDADDKAAFGAALEKGARKLLQALKPAPVLWYTLGENGPRPSVKIAELAEAGERLGRLKTLKFQAGIPLPREQAVALSSEQFAEWALEQVRLLKPLYLAGVPSAR